MIARDLSPLERRAEAAYLIYLEHLRTCPRCALGWTTKERCRGAVYLRHDLREARRAVARYEPRPQRTRRR
ncbi:hypothetical protein GCM10018785_21130 [Streptomyces longispororuber]|uniref:Uncharacterized protein n=1 Tax=Streptomyces longispororuber TaxID=68230 RepID=A0A919DJP7_9ACTN|nr:hypothetical protein [Streptomyces longispororuber]GHE51170.1 hypothetical protein GCM10018785_21130 [Streptomyces longispororuber]